jgi:hypothetical protein
MQIIPHNRHDWLRFLMFPFKAYVVMTPVVYFIVAAVLWPRRVPDYAFPIIGLLFLCGLILLFAALVFAIFGPKGHTFSCVGFAVAAIIFAMILLDMLGSAKHT